MEYHVKCYCDVLERFYHQRDLPTAVPPATVKNVTMTLLAKVPFSTSTVTLMLPESSRTE